jgi:hypothetical protein
MNNSASFKLSQLDRHLIITALDYYLRNKEPDVIAGGIPWRFEMTALLESLSYPSASQP